MQQILDLFSQVLTSGIGGITFFGTWSYLVFRALSNLDLGNGIGWNLNTINIPIPWLW